MRQNLDKAYIGAAFLWLIFGMGFGIWMGVTENFHFSNPHAHANLVGFVVSALFGLILRAYPDLLRSVLAVIQFWAYQISTAILVAGKVLVTIDPMDMMLVSLGSLMTLLSTMLFIWIFLSAKKNPTP